MKTKKIDKKLTLNKVTVANLKFDQMEAIHGGVRTDTCTELPICNTYEPTCETYSAQYKCLTKVIIYCPE